jgi:hypothetical protein
MVGMHWSLTISASLFLAAAVVIWRGASKPA